MKAVTVTVASDGSRGVAFTTDYPKPSPLPHEVLLHVLQASICGTDLEILQGMKQLHKTQVLGHEFVARTVSFGEAVTDADRARLAKGTTVVAELNCVMPGTNGGAARARTAAERAHDPTRSALGIFGRDGAFAEFVSLPAENLHVVPTTMPLDRAMLVEPVAAAAQICEQVHIAGSARVAVVGAGRLGCVTALVLRAMGRCVELFGRRALGVDIGIGARVLDEEVVAQLECRYDVVVDCTGNPAGLRTAIRMTRPLGTIVLKSTVAAGSASGAVDLTPVVVKEISIVGSRCGPFGVALRLLEELELPVERLITRRFAIEDAGEAMVAAGRHGALKVMLTMT